MNKISQSTDYLLPSSNNDITNQEKNNILGQLELLEEKLLPEISLFSIDNKPQQFNYDLKNEYSLHSFEDIQSSKKSEYEFDSFNIEKNGEKGKDDNDNFQKYLNNTIPLTLLKKEDFIEPSMERFPLGTFGDYNNELFYNHNEKESKQNENGKFNKIKKKIEFLVLPNQKKSLNALKTKTIIKRQRYEIDENLNKNEDKINETQINNNSKKLSQKIFIKNYKYKCQHPGCRKTFKTLKLKLNRHDISDNNCKKDTITLLYMIRDTKNMLKRIKRKNKTRIGRLKKLYKKCIFNLPHKDYAINIVGDNLIN